MSNETLTTELVEIPASAPITLFGTDDPVAVVDRASTIATALADVIKRRQLFKRIGQSDHVFVEGWTLLGSMLGVFAEVEWSRPLDDNNGWEARAVARTLAGRTVGAAESMCSKSEGKWRSSDDYAIRSMAQTRAVSKALRLPLGFIMELAGYSATPAEELNDAPGRGASPSRDTGPVPAPVAYRRTDLVKVMRQKGMDYKAVEDYATLIGIPKDERPMSDASMDRLIAAVEGHGTDAPLDLPLTAPETPQEPPKPGTDPYRALEATDKAAARAFWAEREVVPA